MTERVPQGSIESGVWDAIRSLGCITTLAAIEQYTGRRRSESLLRKFGDPDEPKHHISLGDAIAIDAAFVSEGLSAPFLRVHSQLLESWASKQSSHPQLSIAHLTLSIGAAAGLVADAVQVAERLGNTDAENKTGNSNPQASAETLKRLQELDEASAVLRKAVANGASTKGNGAQARANGARG